ncbi:DUF952 domain-containing protein [Streptomyces sp. NPDC054796]|uniref:DUF952 domain-containing protein n=1 Tax=Streptomyces daliensis TaxID=299421 RepID=A0A8T4ISB3_9ACTN|nr:DUF952 domain-containing protein [Streptomyces daliensis]
MIFLVAPLDDWLVAPDRPFAPAALTDDGFVACAPDEQAALAEADARFRGTAGPVMALMIDEHKLEARVRWEPWPHVYGRVNRTAVVGILEVRRDEDGRAVSLALWS